MSAQATDTNADRLRKARLAAGFKSAMRAAMTKGWPYSTYAGHENGTRAFSERDALIYGVAFGVSPDYLIGKVTQDLQSGNSKDNPVNTGNLLEIFHAIKRVPLIDNFDLATFERIMIGEDPISPDGKTEPLPSNIKAGTRSVAISVIDDAMASGRPSLGQGDIGFFDPDAEVTTGNIVAASIVGYPAIAFRRFKLMVGLGGKPHFELIPASQDYPAFSSAEHEINLLGRLIGIWSPV